MPAYAGLPGGKQQAESINLKNQTKSAQREQERASNLGLKIPGSGEQ